MGKRLNFCSIFRVFCIISFLLWLPLIKVDAASFQMTGRNTKTGSFYIWGDDNGTEIRYSRSPSGKGSVLVKSTKGRGMNCGISDGKYLYYNEYTIGEWSLNTKGYLYKINLKTKKKEFIAGITGLDEVCGYYNGNLYITCYDRAEGGWVDYMTSTYRYNLKSRKKKRIMPDVDVRISKGRYLIGMPTMGDLCPLPLYIYDCKNQKKIRLTKKGCNFNLYKGKLYYSEFVNSKMYPSPYQYNIKRCDLNGKNKKTLKKNLTAGYIGRITDQYVYYSKYVGSKEKYYYYNLKKKTVRQMSKKSYWKKVERD